MRSIFLIAGLGLLIASFCFTTQNVFSFEGNALDAETSKESNVNKVNEYGDTPLIQAAWEGQILKVNQLLKSGADVNHRNKDGDTALVFAAWNGHARVVDKLIQSGANVNHIGKNGNTALILAAWNGHTEIVDKLLHSGAKVQFVNKHGNTALSAAIKKNYTDIVERLRPLMRSHTKKLCNVINDLPREMQVELTKHTMNLSSEDEIDVLTSKWMHKLTAPQMMLLYLLKKDPNVMIDQFASTTSNTFQIDFVLLPEELRNAIVTKYYQKYSIEPKGNEGVMNMISDAFGCLFSGCRAED